MENNNNINKHYPFEEGDTYYTTDDKGVIMSCWDWISEELYDANPERMYFNSFEEALSHFNKTNTKKQES
jgi:hypothetical protein